MGSCVAARAAIASRTRAPAASSSDSSSMPRRSRNTAKYRTVTRMRQGYLSAEQGVAWLAGETDPWRTDFVTVGLVTKSDDATHLQQLFRAIKVVIRKIP